MSRHQSIQEGYCLVFFNFFRELDTFMNRIQAFVEFLCRVPAGGAAVAKARAEGRISHRDVDENIAGDNKTSGFGGLYSLIHRVDHPELTHGDHEG